MGNHRVRHVLKVRDGDKITYIFSSGGTIDISELSDDAEIENIGKYKTRIENGTYSAEKMEKMLKNEASWYKAKIADYEAKIKEFKEHEKKLKKMRADLK